MGLAPLDLGRRRSFEIPSVFLCTSISVNSSWDSVEGGGRREEGGGKRKEEGEGRREEGRGRRRKKGGVRREKGGGRREKGGGSGGVVRWWRVRREMQG